MSALGRFGRFTLFSPRVSHSKHLPVFCFVLSCVLVVGFLFPVLQVFGIPNSPRSLDLDDRQGFIASSAMQQKKIHCLYDQIRGCGLCGKLTSLVQYGNTIST